MLPSPIEANPQTTNVPSQPRPQTATQAFPSRSWFQPGMWICRSNRIIVPIPLVGVSSPGCVPILQLGRGSRHRRHRMARYALVGRPLAGQPFDLVRPLDDLDGAATLSHQGTTFEVVDGQDLA